MSLSVELFSGSSEIAILAGAGSDSGVVAGSVVDSGVDSDSGSEVVSGSGVDSGSGTGSVAGSGVEAGGVDSGLSELSLALSARALSPVVSSELSFDSFSVPSAEFSSEESSDPSHISVHSPLSLFSFASFASLK